MTTLIADSKFECLRPHINISNLNTISNRQHADEIGCNIYKIKESFRDISITLIFKRIHKWIIIELVALNITPCNLTYDESYSFSWDIRSRIKYFVDILSYDQIQQLMHLTTSINSYDHINPGKIFITGEYIQNFVCCG